MELHQLHNTIGKRKSRKRRGRGSGSGLGKTSGRGQKGQKSRSGYRSKPGFEGGQMPLKRRLPKVGFTSPNPVRYSIVNLEQLDLFPEGTEVTPELLRERRIIRTLKVKVKILGRGELKKKLTVRAHHFSSAARAAIEEAGGTCREIDK
ncbi:MAG: 50S ribosomal protein L15 [Candidatus Auribacterota bacterium]|nr:50S ribosomal protein L15 [Candidatus Auribacterota bacterium]